GWTGIPRPTAVSADHHEVPNAVLFERFSDPASKDRFRRNVGDDLVHDRVDSQVPQERREVARIQIAVERLPGVVIIEDLRDVHGVEDLQGTDRDSASIDVRVQGLLDYTPTGHDAYQY